MISFKVYGAQVKISFWFLVSISLLILAGVDAVSLLLAMAIHEAGHTLSLLVLGGRVWLVQCTAFGVVMHSKYNQIQSNAADAITVACGPIFGIAAGLFAMAFRMEEFAILNFSLSFFNLLPLEGLDGKSLLNCWKIARASTRV